MRPLLICATLAVICGLLWISGYFGHRHPALDAIAIGRPVAAVGLVFFLGLTLWFLRRPVLGAATLAFAIAMVPLSQVQGISAAGAITVYSKNLYFENDQLAALEADIRSTDPDLVILQEVSETTRSLLDALRDDLPHQAVCPWDGWNGTAILSRWQIEETPRCSPQRSLMAVRVDRPERAFWAVGVHLQQPWPDVQWAHLRQGLSVIDDLGSSVIVAGDFNTVPWSAAPGLIGTRTGTRHVGPPHATFRLFGIGLPLDQVWAGGGTAETRGAFGSDHKGILARVWLSPDG